VAKDITEWRDEACGLTPEIIRGAIVPIQFNNEYARGNNDKKPPAFIEDLQRQYDDTTPTERKTFIEVLWPSELRSYEPPPGVVLVGENHITRGSVFVIGGAPGVGKSRAAVALAEAGATGYNWFGYTVHSKFKTLIVQNENGRFRLKQELAELDCSLLDDYLRITPPPPYGLCFNRDEFREQLLQAISDFAPDVVVIDPWNAVARDDKAKDFLSAFESLRAVIPAGDNGPAIGIVAHTHKPKIGERSSGRALLNLLAGSYVVGSVPRCVFIMQSATDEVTDNRIVWTCCKNNDGELGERSAWERRNGLFEPVHEFDWETFGSSEKNADPLWGKVAGIAEELGDRATRAAIARELEKLGASLATAYRHIETAEKRGAIRFNKQLKTYEPK
jgi:hypothetical protein